MERPEHFKYCRKIFFRRFTSPSARYAEVDAVAGADPRLHFRPLEVVEPGPEPFDRRIDLGAVGPGHAIPGVSVGIGYRKPLQAVLEAYGDGV